MNQEQSIREALSEYFQDWRDGTPVKRDALNFQHPAIRFMIDFLHPNELCHAVMEAGLGDGPSRDAFLWLTNERIVYVASVKNGMFDTAKPLYREIALNSIGSVQYDKGNFFSGSKLTFHISTTSAVGHVAKIDFAPSYNKDKVERFVDLVRNKIMELHSKDTSDKPSSSKSQQEDLISRLERLGNLKTQGLITEEEFIAAKKKLLDP